MLDTQVHAAEKVKSILSGETGHQSEFEVQKAIPREVENLAVSIHEVELSLGQLIDRLSPALQEAENIVDDSAKIARIEPAHCPLSRTIHELNRRVNFIGHVINDAAQRLQA